MDTPNTVEALEAELKTVTEARADRKANGIPQCQEAVKGWRQHIADIKAALKAQKDEEEIAKGNAALQEAEASLEQSQKALEALRAAEKADVERGKELRAQLKEARAAAKEANKAPREQRNGVPTPKPGTITAQLWAIFDARSEALGRAAAIGDVFEEAVAADIKEASVRAGYAHWRKYHGIAGRVMSQAEMDAKAAKEKEEAEKAAAKAAKEAAKEAEAAAAKATEAA